MHAHTSRRFVYEPSMANGPRLRRRKLNWAKNIPILNGRSFQCLCNRKLILFTDIKIVNRFRIFRLGILGRCNFFFWIRYPILISNLLGLVFNIISKWKREFFSCKLGILEMAVLIDFVFSG